MWENFRRIKQLTPRYPIDHMPLHFYFSIAFFGIIYDVIAKNFTKNNNTILKISLSQVIVYIFRDHTVAGLVDRFDYWIDSKKKIPFFILFSKKESFELFGSGFELKIESLPTSLFIDRSKCAPARRELTINPRHYLCVPNRYVKN